MGPSLLELRDRARFQSSVDARRAGIPRVHKALNPRSQALLELAVQAAGRSADPCMVEALIHSKSAETWNRYCGALGAWFSHAEANGFTCLPADPGRFATWLRMVGSRDRGYSQTKARCVAMHDLSTLLGLPSPTDDYRVVAQRALARATKTFRRGPATPILRSEIPRPLGSLGSPPRCAGSRPPRGRWLLSPATRRRAHDATVRHAAVLSDALLRYDDTREGQLGDIALYPDAVAVRLFGTKTDATLAGQSGQMAPASSANIGHDAGPSGAQSLLEGTLAGLQRLAALPDDVLKPMALALAQRFPSEQPNPTAMAGWPAEVRELARGLYERGLLVHCLPYHGPWLWAPLERGLDLAASVSTGTFARRAKQALAAAGVDIRGVGAHSFRRGGAAQLIHGGASRAVLSRALRHRSDNSSAGYVMDAVHVTVTASAMAVATHRSASSPAVLPFVASRPPRRGGRGRGRGRGSAAQV